MNVVEALSTFQEWEGPQGNRAPAREAEGAKQAEVKGSSELSESLGVNDQKPRGRVYNGEFDPGSG
jgi:hypothetical protein